MSVGIEVVPVEACAALVTVAKHDRNPLGWKVEGKMEKLRQRIRKRGVLPHRTKVGRDVVFRRGNPCNAQDVREQHVFIHFNV